ncbi:MAG: hypothetical protein M1835_003437 [Candelina submexicana]|nr:MAG: hypothetical protein M1835_003437 [Candelina submexicana]
MCAVSASLILQLGSTRLTTLQSSVVIPSSAIKQTLLTIDSVLSSSKSHSSTINLGLSSTKPPPEPSTISASASSATTTAPPKVAAPPAPYGTGRCNIHIWEGLGQEIVANSTDAKGAPIGLESDGLNWGAALDVNSKAHQCCESHRTDSYLKEMRMRDTDGMFHLHETAKNLRLKKRLDAPPPPRPLYEKGPVHFAVGDRKWDTSSKQCTVAGWNHGNANEFLGA